jgi:hypothetical protein
MQAQPQRLVPGRRPPPRLAREKDSFARRIPPLLSPPEPKRTGAQDNDIEVRGEGRVLLLLRRFFFSHRVRSL